ncbi:hypothetical protein I3271_03420 [Photobacterium leiognathi]|uniref:hypothetical protein n=1 Tax=Photobacterium leiognathi TaxID=553611 RepID=UPI001EDCF44F|nr:hypothetical protein [Photobacterium leiognathi]MCG3883731.1 hypothetical protein [Photobacterium leiognathi]
MRSKNIEISTTNKLLTTIKVMTNDIDLVKESITEAVTKAPALFTDLAVELSFESSVMTEELVKIISIVESHGIKVALLSGVPQEASKLLNIGYYDQQATKSV